MGRRLSFRPRVESLEDRLVLNSYFLSPTGNDTAAGTEQDPWQTLQHGVAAIDAGDTLILRSGTYAGGVTINDANVTIQSYAGEWAVIAAPTDVTTIGWALRFNIHADGGHLQRLEVQGGYYYTVKTESNFDWGIPEDQRHGASRLLIEDCKLHDSGRDVIKLTPNSDDVTIRRNEIYNSGLRDSTNAEGIDAVNADRLLVQDNYIHDIATNGVYAKGGSIGAIIERNRVENCTKGGGILLGFYTDADYMDTVVNPDLYENIDGVVRHNVIVNTFYTGIGLYSALRPRVENNTLSNVATGGQAALLISPANYLPPDWTRTLGSKDATIVNNIFTTDSGLPFVQIRKNGLDGTLVMGGNCYYNSEAAATFRDDRVSPKFTGNLAAWVEHTHTDSSSVDTDPHLNSDGSPNPDSPPGGAGQAGTPGSNYSDPSTPASNPSSPEAPAAGTVSFPSAGWGGVRNAAGDVTGDGVADVVSSAAPGSMPYVRVFDGSTMSLVREFLAFDVGFRGGVFVAIGDVTGDGFCDIITGAGTGGGPHVEVFSGRDGSLFQSFFAYDLRFAGGVRVAAGDVTGDGLADVITGAGPGGGPHVRVFEGAATRSFTSSTRAAACEFMAYGALFTGGVVVATGDADGDGRADIVTSGGPDVRVFHAGTDTQMPEVIASGSEYLGGGTGSEPAESQAVALSMAVPGLELLLTAASGPSA